MSTDIWVIDTSSLLEVQCCGLPEADQMRVFKGLTDLVVEGRLAVERRVLTECDGRYFDLPSGWVNFIRNRVTLPLDSEAPYIGRVMGEAGNVIQPNELRDPADPYVLALALQLQDDGHEVCVVTNDVRDRLPKKIAMATAAEILGLESVPLRDFLHEVGLP